MNIEQIIEKLELFSWRHRRVFSDDMDDELEDIIEELKLMKEQEND